MAISSQSVTVESQEPFSLCLTAPLFPGVVVSHLFCFGSSTFHSIRLLSRGTCVFGIKPAEEN